MAYAKPIKLLDNAQSDIEAAMANLPDRVTNAEYENLVVSARLLQGTIEVFMQKLKDHAYNKQ